MIILGWDQLVIVLIIKGVKGEFYPCKPDVFEASYESVNSKIDTSELLEEFKADVSS